MDRQNANAIKYRIEQEAFQRWQRQKKPPVVAPAAKTSELNRANNFELRETFREIKGLNKITDELKAFEKKIGDTLDFEKIAPHAVAKKAGEPVARLHSIVQGRVPSGFGTGFLISPQLLITNYHVFPSQEYAVDCAANFLHEYDGLGLNEGVTFELMPDRFFYAFEQLDFAIIAVTPDSLAGNHRLSTLGFLKMIETPGKIMEGQPVNVIQYPNGLNKEYAYKNNLLRHIILPDGFLQYEADTLNGSSGSPVFNEHWELVGLHHCGIPEVDNGKIIDKNRQPWDGENEDDVSWIANEGISISKIVEHLKTVSLPGREQASLLNQLLGNTSDPLLESTSSFESKKSEIMANSTPSGQFVMNFNGPTTINFNMGATPPIALSDVVATPAPSWEIPKADEAQIRFDEDYDNRVTKGYDEDFLEGFNIQQPRVSQARSNEIYQVGDQDYVLKYYHYSLVMNAKRRMMMWGALNADYNKKNKALTRKKLGTDKWRTDDRIPAVFQITSKELYDPAKNIDLGHIIRRDDSAWGYTDQEIEYANADTFHYTNCTPQHEAFNQASPRGYDIHGIWGELENHIVTQLKVVGNKAVVFAGPVLNNQKDPKVDFGSGKIQYPLKFWKVIVVNTQEEGLVSYGFILDQTNVVKEFGLGLERLPDFSKFKKQQVKIKQISTVAGVLFDEQVVSADVLLHNFSETAELSLPFESSTDIVLRRNMDQ